MKINKMKNNTIIHSQKESKDNKFLAYKFRPIRTFCDLCREVDFLRIEEILDEKLYCADWRKLNDVLEGKYTYCDSNNTTEQLLFDKGNRLQNQKEAYRVCSLTKNSTDPLMWAFYASDNTGVAIEIELGKNDNIFSVVYENTIPKIELGSLCIDESDVDGSKTRAIAKHILTHKTKAWAHEKEVRIIVENDKYYTIKKNLSDYILVQE
jgi:hypothetical protein